VLLYTDALQLDPGNHILYSNRSAALLKQGQFTAALQDATQARDLCPQWPKAYFRQGVALQCLGRYGEAQNENCVLHLSDTLLQADLFEARRVRGQKANLAKVSTETHASPAGHVSYQGLANWALGWQCFTVLA